MAWISPPCAGQGQHDLTAFRAQFGLDAEAMLMGGMFRCSAEKRPLLWLDAAALIARERPAVRFMVFGEGPLRSEMQRRIDTSGFADRFRFLPPTADVALALSAFDLLLLTSEWEGTPNVAIEAQAVDTPVVLTGGGGAREAIKEGSTGIYVEQPDPRALADAALRVLDSGGRRVDGAAADFVNTRFGMAQMLARTRELYGPCCASSVAGGAPGWNDLDIGKEVL